jgi:transposase
MYGTYIMRRTQIYLEATQAEALAQRANRRGTTSSHLSREAIDRYLEVPEEDDARLARFRAALDASFGIAPHLPSGVEYVERLRAVDRARDEALERRSHR